MIRSGLVQYQPDLEPLMRDIDSVVPHPENYNNGDVEQIAASIETNGMYRPLYVQKSTNWIISGNHTWEACKTLGATQIPVVFVDVDDLHAKRIMLADNRIAALAQPDPAAELALLEQIAESDSLLGTGYQEHDLQQLRHLAEIPVREGDFASWPTLCFQLPPNVVAAFHSMTHHAGGEREAFELLMRLAGWGD